MTMFKQIEREKQVIARCEKSLALEKRIKRKADTRRKMTFGGLVIKSSMDVYNKAVILGGLVQIIAKDENHQKLFESIGNNLFMNKSE